MYRIGIDLGGTNIAAGLVNESYELVRKKSVPTGAERPGEMIVDDMAALCLSLCKEHGVSMSDITAIGIATPGVANIDTGVCEYTNNINFKKFPLAALLGERLNFTNIKIANDANAAAWGEAVAGAAKGTSNSVMITLGTGVGGGIVIDNKLDTGFNYAGAELGHIVIEHNGRQCSCGRKGCWEAYSSATALINMTNEKLEECKAQGRETLMAKIVENAGKGSGRTAFDAMRAGDAAGKEVVDTYLSYLVTGLVNIVNIFQPEVISLGGGVSNEGQWVIDEMYPYIHEQQYGSGIVEETKIRIAELKNDAGIIGAAVLGM